MHSLIRLIEEHLQKPQKSERWAMYRLITPIVDYANSILGLVPYFEFNQTSLHGTSQSVDIALLDNLVPRVMIEAKRVDRSIAAEQIAKYLKADVRGIVTNGFAWVMCLNGENKVIKLCEDNLRKVSINNLNEIIAFIRSEERVNFGWGTEQKHIVSIIKPQRPQKEISATRVNNPVIVVTDINVMRCEVAKLSTASVLDNIFLLNLLDHFEKYGGIPEHLRCEIRTSRVVFFDSRNNKQRRIARIELGKQQSDVLVLTKLVESMPRLLQIVPCQPHDKGPHMKRFRLSEKSQTKKFASTLADILID